MTKGFVVPAGGGKHYEEAPGRFFDLKLLADQTGQSIMLFEETVPAGTKSTHHLHHDSDEVVWVLEGEFTFKIGDEVFSGGPGTCAFLPLKARCGGVCTSRWPPGGSIRPRPRRSAPRSWCSTRYTTRW